jgi:hypothetical protein
MKIPIEIDLNILETYHLEDLKLVHAIAELIDNSIGSYYRNKDRIAGPLVISITCDPERFVITDNAAGISELDFKSALILGKANRKEKVNNDFGVYGVGLKRSILWIGRSTEFVSKSLEDKKIHKIIYPKRDDNGHILPESELLSSDNYLQHGLSISITDLYFDNVQGFNPDVVEELKVNLGFIYHKFLETEEVFISVNTQKLSVQKREVLVDRLYDAYQSTGENTRGNKYCLKSYDSKKLEWRIPVDQTNGKQRITGWLGIKMGATKSGIGIYVFRDKRGILGIPPAAPYNPYNLKVGDSNYLRLMGEIEIHGFKKPTMGNALPEKTILDQLLLDFKQDVSFERVKFKDDILLKFFKQLNSHKVGMIDSSPCVPTASTSRGVTYSNQKSEFNPKSDPHESTGIVYRKLSLTNDSSNIPPKVFNYVVNKVNFIINIEKGYTSLMTYIREDDEIRINIKTVSDIDSTGLKLICQYILLFDEVNPFLNKPMEFLSSILPT